MWIKSLRNNHVLSCHQQNLKASIIPRFALWHSTEWHLPSESSGKIKKPPNVVLEIWQSDWFCHGFLFADRQQSRPGCSWNWKLFLTLDWKLCLLKQLNYLPLFSRTDSQLGYALLTICSKKTRTGSLIVKKSTFSMRSQTGYFPIIKIDIKLNCSSRPAWRSF